MKTSVRSDQRAPAVARPEMGRAAARGEGRPDLDAEAVERGRMMEEIAELFERNPFLAEGGPR